MLDLLGNYSWIPFNKFEVWSYLQRATNVTFATAIQCPLSIAPRIAHQLLIPPCLCGENCCVQGTCDFHCSFSCTLCLLQGWLSCAKLNPQINAQRIRNIMSCHETSNQKTYIYIYRYLQQKYAHKHTAKNVFIKQFYNCQTNHTSQTS